MDKLHFFVNNILNERFDDLVEIIIEQILKELTYVTCEHIGVLTPIATIDREEIFKKVSETLRSKKRTK